MTRAPSAGRPRAAAWSADPRADAILARLRRLCLAWPGVEERWSWGHPNFRAKVMFAALEDWKGRLCLCFDAGPVLQERLVLEPGIERAPYVGGRGWVTVAIDRRPDWKRIELWMRAAHARATEPRRGRARSSGGPAGSAPAPARRRAARRIGGSSLD